MKFEFGKYGFYYLVILTALAATISFGIWQNWWAMVWSMLTAFYVWLALRELKEKNAITQRFKEYIKKTKDRKSNEAEAR